jgi:hypothetical protein
MPPKLLVLSLSLPQPFVRPQTGGQTDEGFRSLFRLCLDWFKEQSGSLCHEFGECSRQCIDSKTDLPWQVRSLQP